MAIKQRRLPLESTDGNLKDATYSRERVTLFHGDVMDLYDSWESPIAIISDGAYGLGLFHGDPKDIQGLVAWYEPHVIKWSEKATPQTTLWFWNSELGWATVHPLLVKHGWTFVNCHIWDKGISHVAGNSNTQTLRKLPVVTEVCVQYVKEARIGELTLKEWLRSEWERTGLSLSKTNEAAGVANAATRKYFTKDHLWYFPPPEAFEKIVAYANLHGQPNGRPFFSFDGQEPVTAQEWEKMRSKFNCPIGVTNVWRSPQLNGRERLRDGQKAAHRNQKPLHQIELILQTSTAKGDLVWDPFGGIGTVPLAAFQMERSCVSAEIQREFFEMGVDRLKNARSKPELRSSEPIHRTTDSVVTTRDMGTLWLMEKGR